MKYQKERQSFIIFITILICSISSFANASLLISPTRLAFDERDRVQTVTLINPTQKTNVYRVGWTEQKIGTNGSYENLSEKELESFPIASPFMRISPRQVTLGPGERQVVKVMLRRKSDMEEKEYRSHLTFTALPDASNDAKGQSQGMSMKLNLLLSYSIPVVMRKGQLNVKTEISDIEIVKNENAEIKRLLVKLSRTGKMSTTGNLNAYFTPEGTTDKVNVATLNGFNFFPDTSSVTKELIWHTPLPSDNGTLEVIHKGEKEFSGKILASKSIQIK